MEKTKTSKKSFIALAMLLVVLSLFAAIPTGVMAANDGGLARARDYTFQSFGGQTGCGMLNVYTSGNAGNGTNVTTWNATGSKDQKWYVYTNGNGFTKISSANGSYKLALNKYNGYDCRLYTYAGGGEFDSHVIISSSGASRTIKLYNYSTYYLYATNKGGDGDNVIWSTSSGTNRNWKYADA